MPFFDSCPATKNLREQIKNLMGTRVGGLAYLLYKVELESKLAVVRTQVSRYARCVPFGTYFGMTIRVVPFAYLLYGRVRCCLARLDVSIGF